MTRRALDETEQLEMAAAARSMQGEQAKTLQIEAEYDARARKFKEQLDRKEITGSDYDRRMIAAAKLRDDQIEQNAEQVRDRMAGALQSLSRTR